MTKNFTGYSKYFDLLYADKNYKKEVEYIDQHIRRLRPQASTVLELGSGTGNHAQHFSTAGYSITGIERSVGMAAISEGKNIPGFKPVIADMSSFALDSKFDVSVCLFHSLCYLTANEQLLNCFNAVHRHLKASGLFCFDFWYGPAVLNELPARRVKKVSADDLEITRIATTEMFPEQNVAVVNFEMSVYNTKTKEKETFSEEHPMRYLSIPEIDLLCKQSGFKLLHSEKFLEGGAPGLHSWNVFSILQRID